MFACYNPSYPVHQQAEKEHPVKEQENAKIDDPYAFKLNLPKTLTFGEGSTTRQMFMLYFPHELDISGYDVSKVTDMTRMFAMCRADRIDTSTWDTSACENMEGMFLAASAKVIDMSSWDYHNVKNMRFMFMAYSNEDVSTAIYFPEDNTMRAAKGCDGMGMFALCDSKALMLYGLNIEGFSNIDYMFAGCTNLERINVGVETD